MVEGSAFLRPYIVGGYDNGSAVNPVTMSHTVRLKGKLLNRVRRIRGQVDAVERALEQEEECGEVLRRIAAARGAMDSLMAVVLEDHVREHASVKDREAGEALLDVVRAYLR